MKDVLSRSYRKKKGGYFESCMWTAMVLQQWKGDRAFAGFHRISACVPGICKASNSSPRIVGCSVDLAQASYFMCIGRHSFGMVVCRQCPPCIPLGELRRLWNKTSTVPIAELQDSDTLSRSHRMVVCYTRDTTLRDAGLKQKKEDKAFCSTTGKIQASIRLIEQATTVPELWVPYPCLIV